jgi:hypothetical protein
MASKKRELVVRDVDVAAANINEYIYQQDDMDWATRKANWERILRAIAEYKALRRKVKRQGDHILELQATLRRVSRHGRSPEDPPVL